MKEAISLADQGHEVHVVGVRERDHTSVAAIIEERVMVHRVSWQARAYQMALLRMALFGAFIVGAVVLVLAMIGLLFGESIGQGAAWLFGLVLGSQDFVVNWIVEQRDGLQSGWTAARVFDLLVGGLMAVIALVVAWFVFRAAYWGLKLLRRAVRALVDPLRRFANFTANYAEMEKVSNQARDEFLSAFGTGKLFHYVIGGTLERFINKTIFSTTQRARVEAMVEKGRELKPELIYCHEVMALPAAVRLKKEFGVKLIYDAHEMYDGLNQASAHISDYYKKLHSTLLPHVDDMVVVSEAMREIYSEHYEDLPRITVLPNSTLKADRPEYDGRLHDAAGLPHDRKILLYQGGFSPERGIENLVRAAEHLNDDWAIVCMGWGKLEGFINEEAERIGNLWLAEQREEIFKEQRALNLGERRDQISKIVDSFSPIGDLEHYQAKLAAIIEDGGSGAGAGEEQDGEGDGAGEDRRGSDPTAVNVTVNMPGTEAGGGEGEGDENSGEAQESVSKVAALKAYLASTVDVMQSWPDYAERLEKSLDANLRKQHLSETFNLSLEDFDKIRVVPPAPREMLHLWTQGATIGAIPYPNDGLNHWACAPNKLWEYPNAGVPILGSPVLEIYKAITRNDIGWVLPVDPSPRQIADIVNSLTDEDIRAAQEACERFMEESNWDIHTKPWFNLIESN